MLKHVRLYGEAYWYSGRSISAFLEKHVWSPKEAYWSSEMQYVLIWSENCFFVVLHTRCEPAGSRSCAGSTRPGGSARGRSSTGGRSGLGWVKRANYLEGQRGGREGGARGVAAATFAWLTSIKIKDLELLLGLKCDAEGPKVWREAYWLL